MRAARDARPGSGFRGPKPPTHSAESRFEGNDYSVPHTLVRRTVEVRATLARVRVIVDGGVVADHARCFDRAMTAEDPAHIEELKKSKGEARKHRALDRLAQSAPSSQQLFVRLAENGENLGRATQHFLALLESFGSMALELACARRWPMARRATTLCAASWSVSSRLQASRQRRTSTCPTTSACAGS